MSTFFVVDAGADASSHVVLVGFALRVTYGRHGARTTLGRVHQSLGDPPKLVAADQKSVALNYEELLDLLLHLPQMLGIMQQATVSFFVYYRYKFSRLVDSRCLVLHRTRTRPN